MLTDIEIAQGTSLKPVSEIAAELGIREEELELYGRYKAKSTKLPLRVWRRSQTES